jgi:GrpB-like predicted nucleotidyltransferase (UPF0157 family)
MHRVTDLTGRHRSDPAMTAASKPPIGPYRRGPVQVHQADPHAPQAARRLIALIATRWPGTPAEHVGSSAVPDLPGKGIIDLLLPTEPADLPAITQALLELGFHHQLPAVFPASRPMLWVCGPCQRYSDSPWWSKSLVSLVGGPFRAENGAGCPLTS